MRLSAKYQITSVSPVIFGGSDKPAVAPETASSSAVEGLSIVAKGFSVTVKPLPASQKPFSIMDKTISVTDRTVSVTDKTISVTDKTVSATDEPLLQAERSFAGNAQDLTIVGFTAFWGRKPLVPVIFLVQKP